jgi:hypothetical protein
MDMAESIITPPLRHCRSHLADGKTQEILIRAHDGVVAQPISQIIITSDAWLHTFEISLPERPTQQQIDRVAINVPQNRNRFAPVAFFIL